MSLQEEVERLRAKVAAARAGEPEPVPEAAPERKRTVVDFWFREYERCHGIRDDAFSDADAAILNRLAKQFQPSERFSWMLSQFHESREDWLLKGGWSAKQLSASTRGLAYRYAKEILEPKLRAEKADLERELRDLSRDPKVLSLVARVAKA